MQLDCMIGGRTWRRAIAPLALAFAVLAGQQLAALHAFGHALDELQRHADESPPHEAPCPSHAAFADLSSFVPAAAGIAAFPEATGPAFAVVREAAPALATRLAFRSRAPPHARA